MESHKSNAALLQKSLISHTDTCMSSNDNNNKLLNGP